MKRRQRKAFIRDERERRRKKKVPSVEISEIIGIRDRLDLLASEAAQDAERTKGTSLEERFEVQRSAYAHAGNMLTELIKEQIEN
jgi:hypothetical protein